MKTMNVYLRPILMGVLMLMFVNAALAQDYQAKHEVQRGETLAGIAKQYGVTEQMCKFN
ncbi:MAG: LysM peptidoglycan-binding domain-containing protein [Bacteroides sp.]|nr:LysM peptidoglycan-binding domain-containing protein [Bacteroides sp.]